LTDIGQILSMEDEVTMQWLVVELQAAEHLLIVRISNTFKQTKTYVVILPKVQTLTKRLSRSHLSQLLASQLCYHHVQMEPSSQCTPPRMEQAS
jgi:hypothetical protein